MDEVGIAGTVRLRLADWRLGPDFQRFLADLMTAEYARLRPGAVVTPAFWREGDADLGTDSLDQLHLAIAVATILHFSQGKRAERLQEMRTFNQWVDESRSVLASASGALGFKTSGSTGEPRFIVHSFAALAQETEFLARLFGDRQRIVALVPSHHIYGFLFTVLLPRALNIPVLDARPHAPPSLGALLRPGDLIVGFPTHFRAAAQAGVVWPEGVEGATSGAPCPPEAARATRSAGLQRMAQIYGSTETGGIGWRDDGDAPFQLFPYWKRLDDGRLAKDFGDGASLFDLPDIAAWEGLDRLTPLRRRDGAVQIGGVNVFPDFVRAVLLAHPAVADAAVRPMQRREGERLKAFITPKHADFEPEALRQELQDWLRDRLAAAQIPRAFSFGPVLPKDSADKPCDWSI